MIGTSISTTFLSKIIEIPYSLKAEQSGKLRKLPVSGLLIKAVLCSFFFKVYHIYQSLRLSYLFCFKLFTHYQHSSITQPTLMYQQTGSAKIILYTLLTFQVSGATKAFNV